MNQYTRESPEGRDFTALSSGLLLYSVFFIGVLAYGWSHLLYSAVGPFFSWVCGIGLALLGWTIARIVGGHERGIRGNPAFFAALLMLSAMGVFNTLMIHLEGKAIFEDAIDRTLHGFGKVATVVNEGMDNEQVSLLRTRIASLKTQLQQEVMNPRNCGTGPATEKILTELSELLPGFKRYSGRTSRTCDNNQPIVNMYFTQIDSLIYQTPTFVRAKVRDRERFSKEAYAIVERERENLNQMQSDANEGFNLLRDIRPRLEASTTTYQDVARATRNVFPEEATANQLPERIDVGPVRNLGEWGRLLPLVISRIEKPQTWVYIAVAVFLDWVLVLLFSRIAEHRREMPSKQRRGSLSLENRTPW
jgi:hypothetical protein